METAKNANTFFTRTGQLFRFGFSYLRKYRIQICFLYVLKIITVVLQMLTTLNSAICINSISVEKNPKRFWISLSVLVISSIANLIFNWFVIKLQTWIQIKASSAAIRKTCLHILSLNFNSINEMDMSKINQQINNDCNSVIIYCLSSSTSVLENLLILAASVTILIQTDRMILIAGLLFSLLTILIQFRFGKEIESSSLIFKESQTAYFTNFYILLKYWKFLKFNSSGPLKQRTVKAEAELTDSAVNQQKKLYKVTLIKNCIGIVMQLLLFIILGKRVLNGQMNLGTFILSLSCLEFISSALENFASIYMQTTTELSSWSRLNSLLTLPEEAQVDTLLPSINSISIPSVSISLYREGKKSKELSFHGDYTFKKGTIYGLSGPNGIGKSTWINWVSGLKDDSAGNYILSLCRINNEYGHSANLVDYRVNHVQILFQESMLISEIGLSENLQYNGENILEKSSEFSFKLLKDLLDREDHSLSGGEIRSIEIERLLHSSADILVLDEPDTYLDNKVTADLMDRIRRIKERSIIFICSHDKTVIQNCDYELKFIKLDDNNIQIQMI